MDKAVKLPGWLAEVWAGWWQRWVPKVWEYGRFSIDSHFTATRFGCAANHPERADQQHTALRQENPSAATAFPAREQEQHLRSRPRGACGVLLHPTALAGRFGSGGGQRFGRRPWNGWSAGEQGHGAWQLLPLAPTDGTGSPYSSPSGFASKPWLLDGSDWWLGGSWLLTI